MARPLFILQARCAFWVLLVVATSALVWLWDQATDIPIV